MPIGKAFSKAAGGIGDFFKGGGAAVGGKVDSAQSMVTGMRGGGMLRNPAIGLPAAFFGGMFGKHAIYDPMKKAITRDPYDDALIESQERSREKKVALRTRAQYEDLQRRMAQASMRLAALDPHLYNEIMAGRSLPKDAVVFGGQPRTDLMEELSMGMAQGQFKEPPSAHDELMQELGV